MIPDTDRLEPLGIVFPDHEGDLDLDEVKRAHGSRRYLVALAPRRVRPRDRRRPDPPTVEREVVEFIACPAPFDRANGYRVILGSGQAVTVLVDRPLGLGRYRRVLILDEVGTGLDAGRGFEFVANLGACPPSRNPMIERLAEALNGITCRIRDTRTEAADTGAGFAYALRVRRLA